MDGDLPFYATRSAPGEFRVEIWVQPGASKSSLAGEYQGRLKIRVAAPANDNKANKALIAYFAALLGIRQSQIELASGHAARKKTLLVRAGDSLPWPQATDGGR
ncbi:UPF0235 protein yggU [Desulfovibrio sp. X2]|uniref:DUF167 domain-containing protein n=1 Tax=Desulfovibrio sp. X2 TaxID=941449 RepID=UPI000358C3E9|nr:DUF167 domain-containing protein [Desulfovibrio sp. X2]EPR42177.1 UPF0235 protein yggU [Desulfovibrio sp. X2]